MERIDYDEFGLFHENAAEFDIPYAGPPVVRRERVEVEPGRALSALVWGAEEPEFVLLHGGAQNAHTYDTVALALGRPLVAIDLPGHGHSDGGREGSISTRSNAEDVATVIRALAPSAKVVAGMSLGGVTAISLSAVAPELVRKLALIDITPGVTAGKASAITAFINGPPTFPSFEDLLARTIEFNPTRSESSLRRGILHNAVQLEDGSWEWRWARFRTGETGAHPEFSDLWAVLAEVKVPIMLVRGMATGSVVDDADEAKLLEVQTSARVERVKGAGHSVQGDQPLVLAELLDDFAG